MVAVELLDGVEIPISPAFTARWATSFVGVDDFVFLRKPMICVSIIVLLFNCNDEILYLILLL